MITVALIAGIAISGSLSVFCFIRVWIHFTRIADQLYNEEYWDQVGLPYVYPYDC